MARRGQHTYSDDEMRAVLSAAAASVDGALTGAAYDAYRERAGGPHRMAIINRFDSWREACAAAGVSANATRSYTSRWSADEMVGWVAAYLNEAGATASYNGYAVWAKDRDGAPSGPRLRRSFPEWDKVKKAAMGTQHR